MIYNIGNNFFITLHKCYKLQSLIYQVHMLFQIPTYLLQEHIISETTYRKYDAPCENRRTDWCWSNILFWCNMQLYCKPEYQPVKEHANYHLVQHEEQIYW